MNKSVDLYIFRHGETDWNRDLKYQGHTDIPLNKLGLEQAETLIPKMNLLNPEIFLSSDLIRAKRTAETANLDLRRAILESVELRECHLGDSEGMHRDKVLETFGADAVQRWSSVKPEDDDFSFPNGEKKSAHIKRLYTYLEKFMKDQPHYSRIAVSTHGGSVRRLIQHCENAPPEAAPLPNCVLYHIQFERSLGLWHFVGQI